MYCVEAYLMLVTSKQAEHVSQSFSDLILCKRLLQLCTFDNAYLTIPFYHT